MTTHARDDAAQRQAASGHPAAPAGLPTVDRRAALERLMLLLGISAPTGEEKPVADFILKTLAELGVPRDAVLLDDAPSRIPVPCQCGNVIVKLPGSVAGPRRLFSAHMDTVPLARGAAPAVQGDRIVPAGPTALGGDDRTGVGVLLTAIAELARSRAAQPPLTFLFTVREESGLRGASAVKVEDLGRPELAFNFDGSLPEEVTLGATGAMRMEIDVRGLAAHAGVHPERGISAVAIFAAATASLERAGWLGLVERPEWKGTSNIGVVQAGDATNVVTERLTARAEARSHDPAFLQRLVDEFRRAFSASARDHKNDAGKQGEASIQVEESYASFQLPEDSPVVQAALAAARDLGLTPRTRISNGGLDANWLTRKGIPTVSLGCGQHEIHTTAEYVLIEEYLTACRLALRLAVG